MAEQQKEYVTKLIREKVEKNNDKLLASMKSLLDISVQTVTTGFFWNSQQRKANEDQFKFSTKVIDTMAEVSGFL